MKISVIVPVYNVEEYLDQCIQSILMQSYQNLEIILVDDGSTDQSGIICDNYEKNDRRIKVIHKVNGGLSSARNAGLENSTGDYVLFIDSDDYYDNLDGIDTLVRYLDNNPVDVLNFHLKKYYEDGNKYESLLNSISVNKFCKATNYESQILWLVENSQYISSACNKLIKKDLLINNRLFFEEGVLSEDIEWSIKLMILAKSMGVINLNFYVYRQRKNSITHTVSDKHVEDLFNIIQKSTLLIDQIDSISLKKACNHYLSFQYGTVLVNMHYASKNIRRIYYNRIKDYAFLLDFYCQKKIRILYQIKKIFGFKGLYIATYIFSKMR